MKGFGANKCSVMRDIGTFFSKQIKKVFFMFTIDKIIPVSKALIASIASSRIIHGPLLP